MAFLEYNDVAIKGISATIPKNLYRNDCDNSYFSKDIANSIIKMTGIAERRIVDNGVCASDLCYIAAENLNYRNEYR